MMRFSLVLLAAWCLVASAGPAHAGPVLGAIGAVFSAIKGSFVLSALARIAASVVLSRLAQALAPKPKQPGIKTEATSSGSQNPASFILGLYATDGVAVCPPMSHGDAGHTPNGRLTYVIELSDVAGVALNALIINGERCTLGGTPDPDFGLPVTGGTYGGYAFVKFYDGTQTTADAMLLARYGSYPQRPWSSSMVGAGIAYAICTFIYDRRRYTAFPAVRFEMLGIKLYDPRKDTTVGGSGSHRLNNPATWERTGNPVIMKYNIHLGIALPGGFVWGGAMPQADIPLASVFAAANACDVLVDNGVGGTEARFRAGYEVFVSDEPAAICEELDKACLGATADVGGLWKFQAGDPDMPVFFLTDDDVLITLDREKRPFPAIDAVNNGITGSFPDPGVQWEPNEAEPVYNSTWEVEDGGRRRVVNVDFPAVPYAAQVTRLMLSMIADDRRFLTHSIPLPPEATVLEPLDTKSWTSTVHGYTAKTFEIVSTSEDLRTGVVQVSLRERDPDDLVIPGGYFTAVTPPSMLPVIPAAQGVTDFAVSGTTVTGSAGEDRRPALLLEWDGANQEGVRGVEYEVRRDGTTALVCKGTTTDVVSGQMIVTEGILPDTAYEARTILVSERETAWTSWLDVTSPDVQITRPDLADGAVSDEFQTVVLGPLTRTDTPDATVVSGSGINLGVIGPGQIWRLGLSMDVRITNLSDTYEIVLQRRYKQFGTGVFTAWFDYQLFTDAGHDGGVDEWDQRTEAGGFVGNYDELAWRVVVRTRPSVGAGTYQWLRNIYLTFVRVTK